MPIRLLVEFLLLIFSYFLFFPSVVFAALTITDVSPTTINSADDVITISATASGLSNSTQYLQVAMSKEGLSPAQYLGITKNLSGEWYLYKSSPLSADLSAYFYSFTPVASTWSGQIQAKFDTNDSDFLGPGNYVLKLFKYITSSTGTASNNTFTIAVNIASPSSQTTTPESPSPSPLISVNMDNSFVLGEAFGIGLKLENFDPGQSYYLKFRAGTDENTLNKGQTQNGAAFYADTESWGKFPQITTDASGKWEGQISARIGEDKSPGQYFIRLRVRRQDTDTFYDSESKTISLAAPPIIISESPAATKTPTLAKISSGSADNINLVLGTASAATVTSFPPDQISKIPGDQAVKSSEILPVAIVFVTLGTILSSLALLSVKFKIWEKWPMKI